MEQIAENSSYDPKPCESQHLEQQLSEDKGRTLSLLDVITLILHDWRWQGVSCFFSAILGVVVALSIPKIYRSSIKLAPEEAQSALGGNVSSLASMVGLDMKLGTNDAIYPEIYPEVIRSSEFIVGLFDVPVTTSLSDSTGGEGSMTVSYRNYLTKYQRRTWWSSSADWAKRLLIHKQITRRAPGVPVDPARLTMEEDIIARAIDASINCQVDKKTDVISLTVTAQDPLVAKMMVDTVTSRLQDYVTDYRTRKARADLAYIENIYDEARMQYDAARKHYAIASAAHQDVVMETARSMVKALENDMQLKYTIFSQVAEQRQLARANVQKMTPAFTVINNSTVPVRHANIPKLVIVALFAFLGFILRTIVLLTRKLHRKA